uniref:Uncharacterized protein n=1 Tax=Caenorhabditis japonica TaxID=281687 RepID=A0A8R1IV34_CAEJA
MCEKNKQQDAGVQIGYNFQDFQKKKNGDIRKRGCGDEECVASNRIKSASNLKQNEKLMNERRNCRTDGRYATPRRDFEKPREEIRSKEEEEKKTLCCHRRR